MAKIGDALTPRFMISPAEVRISTLANANKLTSAHSIGLLTSATVNFAVESVDLEGGLPRVLHDTAITAQPGTVSAEMREYSRRNIELLMGYTPTATVTEIRTTLTANATAAATTLTVADETGFVAGDLIGIYPATAQNVADISYCLVLSTAANTLNLETDTPILHDYDGTTNNAIIFRVTPVAVGNVTQTNYFSMQVLGLRRDGTPMGFQFWKCALSSGLEMAYSADDFGTTPGEFKVLQPTAAEYGTGGDLEHVAALIANYPLGMYMGGGDA